VSFPIKHGGSFHSYVSLPEGILFFPIKIPIPWLQKRPSKRRSRRPVIEASFQRPSMQSPLPGKREGRGHTLGIPGDLGEALGYLWIHFIDVLIHLVIHLPSGYD